MSDDRRAARLQVTVPVFIKDPMARSNRFILEVKSADISTTGMKIACPQLMKANAHLELVVMPGAKNEMTIFGKVIWVKKCPDDTYQIGISFYSAVPDILAKIQA